MDAGGRRLLRQSKALLVAGATYTVTTTADSGAGSLQQAILDANSFVGVDTITFSLGAGPYLIQPSTALPVFTDAVVIDGSAHVDGGGRPLVRINGGAGIDVEGDSTVIGGTGSGAGNVISGNGTCGSAQAGIELRTTANGTVVQGNAIGTNAARTAAVGNGSSGIRIGRAYDPANARANGATPDEIRFSLVGARVHSIVPGSDLPAITDAVVLDGTTQPGHAGTPLVFLDGSVAACGECGSGLVIEAGGGGSTIRGLAIGNFDGWGIRLLGSNANVIEGCWIELGPPDATYEGSHSGAVPRRGRRQPHRRAACLAARDHGGLDWSFAEMNHARLQALPAARRETR